MDVTQLIKTLKKACYIKAKMVAADKYCTLLIVRRSVIVPTLSQWDYFLAQKLEEDQLRLTWTWDLEVFIFMFGLEDIQEAAIVLVHTIYKVQVLMINQILIYTALFFSLQKCR